MNQTPPFPFPPLPGASLLQNLVESLQPPEWVVDEVQNRIVLLLNHVLLQEPQAQDRVRRQQGKTARMTWGRFEMALRATPAGLLERPGIRATGAVDLTVSVADAAMPALMDKLLRGEKPSVSIDGDVQLAADVAWLVDNLRWDVEEDLSRVMGDAPAHTLVKVVTLAAGAVRTFASQRMAGTFGGNQP